MADELVLVTGGSGYIASQLITLLLEEGCRVRTTVRDSKNEKKIKHLNDLCPDAKHKMEVVDADLTDPDSWPSAVAGCRYVYHVASPFPLESPRNPDDVIKPAVEGTLNVLKACAAAKTVKRVVLTSSIAAIIDFSLPSDYTISEKDWQDPEDRRAYTYGRSKVLAEKAAWKFVEELPDGEKFELAAVNPGLVMGPVLNATYGSSVDVMNQILKQHLPMVPMFFFPLCDVRDVALAHYRCMTRPEAAGNRHIVMTTMMSMKEMSVILDKEFRPQGYNITTRQLPNALLSFLCFFNSDIRNVRDFSKKRIVDISRFTQVLGITPTPIEKTLIDMAHNMIKKGITPKSPKYTGPTNTDEK